MKKIIIGAAALVILVAGILAYVLLNVDSIVKMAVNEFGPKVTQTEVVLEGADIGLFSGSGSLNGLRVGNPVNRGFKPRELLSVGVVSVKLDRDSLLSDTILIHEIVIQAPKIAYETQGKTDNFEALLKNIKESTGGDKAAAKPAGTETEKPAAGSGPEKKIIIENVYIREGAITADITGLPGEGLTLDLPEIHLTDIGKDSGGASPAEAAAAIVKGLYAGMEEAFKNSGDFAMKGGEWVIDQTGGAVDGVSKGAKEGVGGAVDSVKSLF
ncbi:AsmA family protein [Paucidesulfovibrio longus]|uniref:hypothetical protein n=1 Tax=Paucidesulfovibrio longus TaxID=889 RepID=UPI0003B36A4D|nr:hypothetical protein [Paucidesulfovibrio longus]